MTVYRSPKSSETSVAIISSYGGHIPMLVRGTDDAIVAILRGSTVAGFSGLQSITSPDGGKTWLEPRTIIEHGCADTDLAVGLDASGAVIVVYTTEDGELFGLRSSTNGMTWEPSWSLPSLQTNDMIPRGQMVTLRNKTLLMPAIKKNSNRPDAFVVRSTEHGANWSDATLVGEGYDEISLTINKSKTDVIAAMRSSDAPHKIVTRRSPDYCRNWEQPVLVAEDAEHVYSLSDFPGNYGYQFLLYRTERHPFAIHLKLSKDDGHIWRKEHDRYYILDGDTDSTFVLGHPFTVVNNEGWLVTVFGGHKVGNLASNELPASVVYAMRHAL